MAWPSVRVATAAPELVTFTVAIERIAGTFTLMTCSLSGNVSCIVDAFATG